MQRSILALVIPGAMLSGTIATARAQTPDDFSIHVESNQVLVPTYVFYKDRMAGISETESRCFDANEANFRKLRSDEAFIPQNCLDTLIRGLAVKDFHIFEDGIEQKIQNVTFENAHQMDARDNFGDHIEWSETPRGKWSDSETQGVEHGGSTLPLYRIAYVPPESAEGSCHRVELKVDRTDASVYSRSHYCNIKHAPEDPLSQTPLGKRLEEDASSEKRAKIDMSLQIGFFYAGANAARVDLALTFPWGSLKREWKEGTLYATIGVLGLLYRKDRTLASRFSDFGCCSSDQPNFVSTNGPHLEAAPFADRLLLPTRYETQVFDLIPGEYSLHLILSDGSKFGRADMPLNIESYDGKHLTVSSVMLCKRFRDAAVAAQEAAAFNLAPQYVPLVSKGVQFTPTGDTTFRKSEPLFAYFEVYEPLLTGTPAATVQTQLRITDVKTGQIKVDTGPRSAADWIEPGKSAIRIAEQIAVDKLPKGSYRLAVQATDSAGRSTVWRTADFTVE